MSETGVFESTSETTRFLYVTTSEIKGKIATDFFVRNGVSLKNKRQ